MKNKHLVLLFLAALLIGLLTRHAPWAKRQDLRSCLVCMDTASVQEITIQLPGHAEVAIVRTETDWTATHINGSVAAPAELINPMLQALQCISAVHIVKTERRDTLCLDQQQGIQVNIRRFNGASENFVVGRDIRWKDRDAGYILLPGHDGAYLCDKSLNRIFNQPFEAFRRNDCFRIAENQIIAVYQEIPGLDTIRVVFSDSLRSWTVAGSEKAIHPDSISVWIQDLLHWKKAPFADYFYVDIRADDDITRIRLDTRQGESLTLRLFPSTRADLPDDLHALPPGLRNISVLHSSQKPNDLFAIPDTGRINRICRNLYRLQQPNNGK